MKSHKAFVQLESMQDGNEIAIEKKQTQNILQNKAKYYLEQH